MIQMAVAVILPMEVADYDWGRLDVGDFSVSSALRTAKNLTDHVSMLVCPHVKPPTGPPIAFGADFVGWEPVEDSPPNLALRRPGHPIMRQLRRWRSEGKSFEGYESEAYASLPVLAAACRLDDAPLVDALWGDGWGVTPVSYVTPEGEWHESKFYGPEVWTRTSWESRTAAAADIGSWGKVRAKYAGHIVVAIRTFPYESDDIDPPTSATDEPVTV